MLTLDTGLLLLHSAEAEDDDAEPRGAGAEDEVNELHGAGAEDEVAELR